MPSIVGVSAALPSNYYTQGELTQALVALSKEREGLDAARTKKLFAAVRVEGRHLALPLARYAELNGFGERNREWLKAGLELGERAVRECLGVAGLAPNDVQLFASSTVTGIAVPSIEARLMNRLGFAADCRRVPLFGLGCLAGAAGIARVNDYLKGHPTHAALLLCVELCSLTFQPDDVSVANLIACGLFGDGAACVLLVGDEHPLARGAKLKIEATRSVLFPNTEAVMGWDIVDTGFRIVLSGQVPELAQTALAHGIRAFLSANGLHPSQITRWVAHPGGPAVIDAMERGLELPHGALAAAIAWRVSAICRRPPCWSFCKSRWLPITVRVRACSWRWALGFARSWCCCDDDQSGFRGVRAARGAGAIGRAEAESTKREPAPRPGRPRACIGPLQGHAAAAHALARERRLGGDVVATSVSALGSALAALGFGIGQCLRYAAIHALGRRWSVRVLTVPGAAPVTSGIYRYLRHPNYLGVVLEIAALPLMHSAWRSAIVFSLANAVLLAVRIRKEELALSENGGYVEALGPLPRLWPSFRARGAA